ncbi:MAG: putative DNA binding domain-containing protein [Acidimicrobiaceae bacterium]|nr:putative DNA binding domain-containing protein [Acidimicrobiaceae bacterium]
MANLESDLVERKRSASDLGKISRTVCAFANDLSSSGVAGVLFVGVEDDGSCADTQVSDGLLKDLASLRDNGLTLPLPSLDVDVRTLNGCEVAVVTVQPSPQPPVRYKGRVYVRVGPTTRLASHADENRLGERRRAIDLPYDSRPEGSAQIPDLNLDYIESQYFPSAIADDVLKQNQRSLNDQLRSLRLQTDGHPTVGALLAFANDPLTWLAGAYVQFVRFDGTDVSDPIKDQKLLSGLIPDVLREVETLFNLGNSTALDLSSGPRERRFASYPMEAMRQIAHNAVMHRSYENTNNPIRIYWYDDRVEIESPGGLHGDLTKERLLAGETAYRNPLIAEILRNMGFAQTFGVGIARTRRALEENGNPEPEFYDDANRFIVTLRAV